MIMKEIEIQKLLEEIRSRQNEYKASGYGHDSVSTPLVDELAHVECAGLTARRARFEYETGVERDPIVLSKGKGAFLWDADGLPYVDMGACFAVAAYGHSNP